MKDPPLDTDRNPLEWWGKIQTLFSIGKAGKDADVHSCYISSSKRIFSTSGNIQCVVRKLRSSLTPENVKILVF